MLGSLSRPQYLSPLPDAGPHVLKTCCIQPCWKAPSAGTLASLGSLKVIGVPTKHGKTSGPKPQPLPQSPSVSTWGPYCATEKLHRVSKLAFVFATQPTMGMVRNGCAPAALVFEMNVSPSSPGVWSGYGMLSKYQSTPRLSMFCCQL